MSKNTIILGCSSLEPFIETAQRKAGTAYPVVLLDRTFHRDPKEMREHIRSALQNLDEQVDTVLVAMGFCGGSWDEVEIPCKVVIPKVDDCITLLLQCSNEPAFNLKEEGHLYVREEDPKETSFRGIFERMTRDLDKETRTRYHEDWKSYYHQFDIIETGLWDCRSEDYAETVRADADWLDAEMNYVPGGTHLLEKLVAGNWDSQFLVLDPQNKSQVTEQDFLR